MRKFYRTLWWTGLTVAGVAACASPLAAQSRADTLMVRAKRDSLAAEGTTGLTTRYRLIHELLAVILKPWGTTPAPVPPPPPPPPPPPSGERVRLVELENVFRGPGIATGYLGQQRANALGTRTGACRDGEGWRWCPVDWDSGPDGWVLEHKLVPAAGSPPPPPGEITVTLVDSLGRRTVLPVVRCTPRFEAGIERCRP